MFFRDSVHGSGSFSHRGSGARLRVSTTFGSGRRSIGGSGGGVGVGVGGLMSPPPAGTGSAVLPSPGTDIDSFLNDFEENAASMSLAPPRHPPAAAAAPAPAPAAITSSSGGSVLPPAAAAGIAAAEAAPKKKLPVDETGTDAFMDELEDLIR